MLLRYAFSSLVLSFFFILKVLPKVFFRRNFCNVSERRKGKEKKTKKILRHRIMTTTKLLLLSKLGEMRSKKRSLSLLPHYLLIHIFRPLRWVAAIATIQYVPHEPSFLLKLYASIQSSIKRTYVRMEGNTKIGTTAFFSFRTNHRTAPDSLNIGLTFSSST